MNIHQSDLYTTLQNRLLTTVKDAYIPGGLSFFLKSFCRKLHSMVFSWWANNLKISLARFPSPSISVGDIFPRAAEDLAARGWKTGFACVWSLKMGRSSSKIPFNYGFIRVCVKDTFCKMELWKKIAIELRRRAASKLLRCCSQF